MALGTVSTIVSRRFDSGSSLQKKILRRCAPQNDMGAEWEERILRLASLAQDDTNENDRGRFFVAALLRMTGGRKTHMMN